MEINIERLKENATFKKISELLKNSDCNIERIVYSKLFEEIIVINYLKDDKYYNINFTIDDSCNIADDLDLSKKKFELDLKELDFVVEESYYKTLFITKNFDKIVKKKQDNIRYIIDTINSEYLCHRKSDENIAKKFKDIWFSLTNKDRLVIISKISNSNLVCFSQKKDFYYVGFPIIYENKLHEITFKITTEYSEICETKLSEKHKLNIILIPVENDGIEMKILEKNFLELTKDIIYDFQILFYKLCANNKIKTNLMLKTCNKIDFRFPIYDNNLLLEFNIPYKKDILPIIKVMKEYCIR